MTHSRLMAGNSWAQPLEAAVRSSASGPYGTSWSRGVWQAAASSWPAHFTGAAGTKQSGCWGLRSLVAPAALTASAHKTRTQTADLCYQAADIDNSQMVVTAVGGRAAC